MSKNLMPEVAKMLGVEIGEEFMIINIPFNSFHFTETKFLDRDGDDAEYKLYDLITNKYTIQKLPRKPQLTEAERVILENLPKQYKWIARDKEKDNLYIYTIEPNKEEIEWYYSNSSFQELILFNHLFQFIKWEGQEPYNIEELLKGE